MAFVIRLLAFAALVVGLAFAFSATPVPTALRAPAQRQQATTGPVAEGTADEGEQGGPPAAATAHETPIVSRTFVGRAVPQGRFQPQHSEL
jgi:hypothetical protein